MILPCAFCSWLEEGASDASEVALLSGVLKLLRVMPFEAAVLEASGPCLGRSTVI